MSEPTALDVLIATVVGVLLGSLLSYWVATKASRRAETAALAAEERMLERERVQLASQVSVWVDLDDDSSYYVLNRTNAAIHSVKIDFTLLYGTNIETMQVFDSIEASVGTVPPVGEPAVGKLPESWRRRSGHNIETWFCIMSASFHDMHGDQWRIGEDGVVARGATAEEVEQAALMAAEQDLNNEQ